MFRVLKVPTKNPIINDGYVFLSRGLGHISYCLLFDYSILLTLRLLSYCYYSSSHYSSGRHRLGDFGV